MDDLIQTQPVGGVEPVVEPTVVPVQEPNENLLPNELQELGTKKGYKTVGDFVSNYQDNESNYGKLQNKDSKIKEQLEAAGCEVADDGTITQKPPVGGTPAGTPYVAPATTPTTPEGTQPQEIYDEYTGQYIDPVKDPVGAQLVHLPVSQRTYAIADLVYRNNETTRVKAIQTESEVMALPEAKGFETELRNEMALKPAEQRISKESWSAALLTIKGRKYDEALKSAGQEGVDSFIEKQGIQNIAGTPAASVQGGAKLTKEQETAFQHYAKTQPRMFKDRNHFLARCQPTGEV